MGVETVAAVALATAIAGTGASMYTQHQAQKAQEKQAREANRLAEEAENERKKEAAAVKEEQRKERIKLVDEQRAQLGAGLSLDTMGTKFKKTTTTTANTGTLG